MVLNEEHHQDFGRIMAGLMKQILVDGYLDTSQVEGQEMIKDRLTDRIKL